MRRALSFSRECLRLIIKHKMKKLCLLLFFAIFTEALCQSEVEFCTAIETLVINGTTPDDCIINYCNTAGVTFTCFLQAHGIAFETQFSIHLCTNPPRIETTQFGNGKVLIDLRLTESTFISGALVNTNITFNVNEDTIEFGTEGIDTLGGNVTVVKIERTVLPYNSSLCPANISGTIFECPPINIHTARTIHELKPNDIKVIGAIGNSLTAGFLSLGTLIEYKGVSFSGGGFGTVDLVTTLPNILKEYNPDLIGFSAELSNSLEESLNVGFTRADTGDMMVQTQQLIQRVQNHPKIDFENDWKLVTVLIGYNDVCVFSCDNSSMELLDEWIANFDESLILMRDNLPRTFVNLIQIAQVSVGLQYVSVSQTCAPIANFICPCTFAEGDAAELSHRTIELFNQRLTELVDSRKYDISNDFTVVVQPYLTNAEPIQDENGTVDISYIAFDCIHLTASGNRISTTALWRNMFQPVGSKSTDFNGDLPPICPPSDFPYLTTYLNSANCPPLCTHAFCSSPETRRSDCTIPGVLSTCYNRCAITSCRACYYSEIVRPTPDTDLSCLTIPGTKCSRQWVTRVRRADLNTYDSPRRMRTQEFFKCYQVPCPEIRG